MNSPILLLILYAYGFHNNGARELFYFFLGGYMCLFAISSAALANTTEQKLETKLESKKLQFKKAWFAARFGVLVYSTLSLSCSTAILKSSFQKIGWVTYTAQDELQKLIYNDRDDKLILNKSINGACENFIKFLDDSGRSNLKRDMNFFLFVFKDETMLEDKETGERVRLSYIAPSRNSIGSQTLYYENASENTCLLLLTPTTLIDSISITSLKHKINQKINEIGIIQTSISAKPDVLLPYAFSSFCSQIGVYDFEFEALDEKTKKFDAAVLWIYYAIGGIFLVWIERSNRS